MEKVSEFINAANAVWDLILGQPAHILLAVALNVVGFMLKRSPVPNNSIPWVIVVGGAVGYPFVASPGTVSPDYAYPTVILVLFGTLLGFGAWILHRLLLKRVVNWLPAWVQGVVTGQTEILTKPPTPPSAGAAV